MKNDLSIIRKFPIIIFLLLPILSQGQRERPPVGAISQTPVAAIQNEPPAVFYDGDKDGIDDNVENKLLERFRPYYKFSINKGSQDEYRPVGVLYYLRCAELNTSQSEDGNNTIVGNSTLAGFPTELFLQPYRQEKGPAQPHGSPMLTKNYSRTDYYINPLETVAGISGSQPGRHGNSWEEVLTQKNIGLYGHVVPIKLQRPQGYDRTRVLTGNDEGNTYYKIEFWQFFGFNEVGIGGAANHEGDWTTVQLLYNLATDKPEAVFHYAHGKIEFRFFLSEATSASEFASPPQKQPVEIYKEYRGRNYNKYADIVTLIDNYSHNTLRMLQDPVTREFSHPFVYIEWGAHEFWPSESGFFPGVPTHNGEGYSFLTAAPINLGEVENSVSLPGNRNTEASLITGFNGYWGTYGGPPVGPPLHYQWTWPASSSIRWQLKGSDMTD